MADMKAQEDIEILTMQLECENEKTMAHQAVDEIQKCLKESEEKSDHLVKNK